MRGQTQSHPVEKGMARLKSRTEFPPGSFQFLQPQTGWSATAGSFDSVVRQVIGHRAGNRAITKQYNLATDYDPVANEVDEFNAARCLSHGWDGFIINAPAQSFRQPTPFKKLQNVVGGAKRVVAGVKAVALWLGDGLKPVEASTANGRASICAVCPQNGDPNFIERLSAEGAAEIKTMMAIKHDLTLTTPFDAKLHTCKACSCHLPLKVFAPLDYVTKTMSAATRQGLDQRCWILLEEKITPVPSPK